MSLPVRSLADLVAVAPPQKGFSTCFEVLAVIQSYADGECDVGLSVAIASHLDRCGHCACELESLRWLKAAVRRCGAAPESPAWH